MISVRLFTGQVLQFPDDTPEDVMRRAAHEVIAGHHDVQPQAPEPGTRYDLSNLRRDPGTMDLSHLRVTAVREPMGPPKPEPIGTLQSEGLPTAAVNVDDTGRHTSRVRRFIDAAADAGYAGFGTLRTVLDTAEALPEAAGLVARTAVDANVQAARNLPRLPLLAAEELSKHAAKPLLEAGGDELYQGSMVPDPMAEVAKRTEHERQHATEDLAEATQTLPTPIAAAVFHGATTAGLAADASQYIGGEGRAFGAGREMTELEQAAAARSGEFLPGAKEPLLYHDSSIPSPGWKGRIPDKLRELTGQPWRRYGVHPWRRYGGPDGVALERPTGPAPKPRAVEGREPVPVKVVASPDVVDEEGINRIMGLWDYASKRYPRITSQVKELRIHQPGSVAGYYVPETGTLSLGADTDLGILMHELTHAAQGARRQIGWLPDYLTEVLPGIDARAESFAVRAGDVYSRIPQPLPRRAHMPELAPLTEKPAAAGPAMMARVPESFRERVLVSRGLTDEELRQQVALRMRRSTNQVAGTERPIREPLPIPPPEVRSGDPWVVEADRAAELRQRGFTGPLMVREGSGYRPDLPEPTDEEFRALADHGPDSQPEALSYNGISYYGHGDQPPPDWVLEQWDQHVRQSSAKQGHELAPVVEFPAGQGQPSYTFGNMLDDALELPVANPSGPRRLGENPVADQFARETTSTLPESSSGNGPTRLYAANPIPRPGAALPNAGTPAQIPLTEEQVAQSMGWKPPSPTGTSPQVTGPPVVMPEFQTNIAAQLGGDQQVANYVIQQSDDVFKAIGPPQTWDTLEEMASRLGTTKEEFLSQPSHWAVMSPETRMRLLYVVKGNENKIQGLQSKLVAGAATDAEKAELLQALDTRGELLQLGARTGSAYGRALNSLKMEARLALSDDQLLRQQIYKHYRQQIDAQKPLLETLARLDPANPEELQAFLRQVNRPKWYEYAHEYWVSSILSAPTSHLRNLIGNSTNAVMENAVVRPVAAVLDAARVAGTGAEREIFLRETPAAIVGLTQGIRQGFRRGLEVIKRGYDPIAMQGKLFPMRSAFARSQNRVVREVVGPVVTFPLRMLAASDAVFKTMNYTAELYAQAARIASKEGLAGSGFAARTAHLINNPTDEMIAAADSFALKSTFNDDASAIGKAVMGLRDLPGVSSANPGIQKSIEAYRAGMGFILPFIKIADRLMVRGFEYTPLGLIPAIGARRAGNFAQAADYAARAAIGSGILSYAASLGMEGRLTAGAPTDEAEKAAFYAANKQPWSVRTDNGTWIPFAGLQPIGTPFAMAAAAWKGWQEHGDAPDIEKLGHAAAQIGQYVTNQSYMDGLAKFMDAISGSERDRGRAFSDLATNTVWGFAPYSGLTRSITKAIDPRVIDAETIGERLKQNIPGVSLSMDAKLTPWGEDVVPVGGKLRPLLPPGSLLLPSQEQHGTQVANIWNHGMATVSGAGRGNVDNDFNTQLTPAEEAAFAIWKLRFAPNDSGEDYDLRGAFKAKLQPDPATGHWPDTFKKPNHPTFSDQSIYAADAPGLAGRWDANGRYVPPREYDLDSELQRLGMPLGYVGKTMADRFGGGSSRGTWKLNQREWGLYQRTAGRATRLLLERLYAKPGYENWDVEVQRDRTQQAIDTARKYARVLMVRYHRGYGIPGTDPLIGDINALTRPAP